MIKFTINLARYCLYAAYSFLLLLLITLRGGKYDWMSEIDPSIQSGDIVDDSGDRTAVKIMIVIGMVLLQVMMLGVAQRRHERKFAFFLMAVAVVTYYITR